jgi:hypothetical protein
MICFVLIYDHCVWLDSSSFSLRLRLCITLGEVVNLMRGQGAASHRLRSSNLLTGSNDGEAQLKRQFQHPAFSSSGQ